MNNTAKNKYLKIYKFSRNLCCDPFNNLKRKQNSNLQFAERVQSFDNSIRLNPEKEF